MKNFLQRDQEDRANSILEELQTSERLKESTLFAIKEGRFNSTIMISSLCKEKAKPGAQPKTISDKGRNKVEELRKIAFAVRKRKDAAMANSND